ncbi:MAG: DsbA family protein [Deltaproteobacteria bacterium]|nr:DsbA family protein [Deltaproteobacteria bacterium]
MAGSSGGGSVVAALVLGAAIVVGSLVVKNGIDGQTAVLLGVQDSLAEIEGALAGGPLRADRAEARRGPDPSKKVEIAIDGAPVRGPAEAEVTIVEYSDFQCPFCARVVPTLDQLRETYGDRVKLVYKHLPLRIHPEAPGAAAAAEAAGLQGKFWEMHDKIFANQRELSDAKYVEWARALGLDLARFEKDRRSEAVRARIAKDEAEANRLGVSGTPAFFINGRFLSGAQPIDAFQRVIDDELKG